MKKVGKTTRPFIYDLNQVLYQYTLEVKNRFKRLELVDRVPVEVSMEVHNIVQEAVIKTIPKKNINKKAKLLSEVALQTSEKRRDVKSKGERERYTQMNADFQQIARRDKKPFLSEQCKVTEAHSLNATPRVPPVDSCVSRSVVSDSLRPHGVLSTRLLRPCDSPGKNTRVGCHALLQGIFPSQRLNPGLPHALHMDSLLSES